jgi:PST family polysaccharide transporter
LRPNRLSTNTVTLLFSNVGSAGLSFLLSVLIGRALGEDGLGVYAATLAWIFPLVLITEFGMNTLIVREATQNPDVEDKLLWTAIQVFLLLGLPLILVLAIATPLLSSDPQVVTGLRISAPFIVISPCFGAFTAVFRARQRMWPIALLNIGMLVVQVFVTTFVFLAGGDVLTALAVNTATSVGQLGAAWWIWRNLTHKRIEKVLSWSVRLSYAGETLIPLLRKAWPFALAAILAALQTRIGVILLEQLAGKSEVGYYAAATRFVEAGRMIPNALFGALFPTLAALAINPQTMQRTFRKVMLGLAAFGLTLAIVFTWLSSPMMTVTYGERFLPAVPILQITMWALLPSLLRAGQTLYWYSLGQEKHVNKVTAFTLVIQVMFSLWLIPQLGATGVALINLLIESAALALLWWNPRRV